MAETIGRAYIKILADGAGLGESIRKEMDKGDVDKAAQEGGRDFSKSYAEGYEEEEKKNKNFSKSLSRTLDKGFEEMNHEAGIQGARAGTLNADRMSKNIEKRLRASFPDLEHVSGDLGVRMGDAMRNDFIKHGDFTKTFGLYLKQALADQKQFEDQIGRDHAAAIRINKRIDQKAEADRMTLLKQHAAALRINAAIEQGLEEDRMRAMRQHTAALRMNDAFDKKIEDDRIARLRQHTEALRLNAAFDQRIEDDRMKMLRLHTAALRIDAEREKKIQADRKKNGNAFIKTLDDIGDAIGKSFGKGSRNNFVNFVGSFVGGLASIPAKIASTGLKIKDFGVGLADAFTGAKNPAIGLIAVFGEIAPAIGGAVVAFTVLDGILSVASSGLLLTAGAAAALVSTLAFGLVGAVAPLVGLLGPIGVAAGGVALAFATMDKATRKATLKPFTDGLKKLGKVALPGILDGLNSALDRLSKPQGEGTIKLFERFTHMVKAAGDGVGKFLDNFAIGIRGPGLGQFLEIMKTTLPKTMGRLGRIFGNTFEGILGTLATLNQPGGPVDTLLTSLDSISKGFAHWSVSPDAVKFFNDARDSAKALMDFLGPVWDLLSKVLEAGKGTGDSMFSQMGDAVQKFSDSLSTADLSSFFADAKRMGDALGKLIIQVGKLFDALDTPVSRGWAIDLVNVLGDLIGALATVAGWFGGLNGVMQSVVFTAGAVFSAMGLLAKVFAGGQIATFVGNVRNAETRLGALQGAAKLAAGGVGIGLLIDGLHRADNSFSIFEDGAGGALAGFAVGGPWGAAIGGAGGLIAGLALHYKEAGDKARDAYKKMEEFSPVKAAIANLEDLKSTLDQVTGAYTTATRAGVLQKLQQSGAIDAGRKFGLSAREIVNAVTGQGGAFQKLRPIFQDYGSQIDTVKQKQKAFIDEIMKNAPNTGKTAADWRKELLGGTGADADKTFLGLENQKKALRERRQELGLLPGVLRSDAKSIQETTRITQDLTGKLQGIPKNIRSKIVAEGILPTTRGVAEIARKYNLLDGKKIKTLISASGATTSVKAVQRVIDKLNEASKKKPKPKIEVDPKPANNVIDGMLKKLGAIGNKIAHPGVDLKTEKFDSKNNDVKRKADTTGRLNPKIKVDAETAQASSNLSGIHQQVDNLPSSKTVTITVNTIHRGGGNQPGTASGGLFTGAQSRIIGEAGPEAVVPLMRPLSMVDPAVRELSAIAQGMRGQRVVAAAGKTINVGGINIVTPTKDPRAVATETINRLVAVGY